MSIIHAMMFAVLYWLATNKLWYGALHLTRQPLVLALPIGIILGDVSYAMKIGAALQMIYLGAIAPGGTLPSDEALAACVTIPLALVAKLSPEIAVSIAMPLGLLGVLIDNVKRTYHSYFVHQADVAAENLDKNKMNKNSFLYPLLLSIPLRVIPVFLALFFGVDAIQVFLSKLPQWAINGLSVAGGILPALGFAVTIMVIGKKSLLPYFVLGFSLAAYSNINMIGLAIIAVCIAFIQAQFKQKDFIENKNLESEGDF